VKKIALGCGLVVVLLAIAGAVGMYYFVYKPARSFVTSMSQVGEIAELDAKVANTATFTAPADGALSEAQVRRFAAVQEQMHTRLGARTAELQEKYKALDRTGETPGVAEAVGAWRDLLGIIAEAKHAQVDALNAQQFSLAEYGWVKSRFYEAAGVAITGIDFREMAGDLQSGNLDALEEMASKVTATTPAPGPHEGDDAAGPDAPVGDRPGVGIPDANRTLVAPYKEKAQTWMVYAAFGL
jgi:hypothetical protein